MSMLDDDVTTTLPLHFNFDFFCTTYNQVRICSNGFITFDFSSFPFSGTPYPQNLPSSTAPNAVIAWNWNDLDPSVGGSVSYTTIGVSPNQKFIVTYSAVPLWTPATTPSTLLNTGQIILHESTNLIEIHIAQATNYGWFPHTEGIEDAAAGLAVTAPGRNFTLWNAVQSSYLFAPYSTGSAPVLSGDTLLCEGTTGNYSSTILAGAQGYHWTFPSGWVGTGSTNTLSAYAGSAGTVSVAAIYTCGNSPPATLQVNAMPAPQISITSATPDLFCSNTVFSLSVQGAQQYSLYPGALTSAGFFTTQPASSVIYTVTGESSQGCLALESPTVAITVNPSPTITVNSGTVCAGQAFTFSPSGAINYTYSSVFQVLLMSNPGTFQYSVTGLGTNGCISAPAISTVFVPPTPTFVISADRQQVCSEEPVVLTASGGQSYTWQPMSVKGSTLLVFPKVTTNYQLFGTDFFGCFGKGAFHLPVEICTGVMEQQSGKTWIWPNPSPGKFFCEVSVATEFSIRSTGNELFEQGSLYPGLNELDLSYLAPGVYLIHVLTKSGSSLYQKLIVQ